MKLSSRRHFLFRSIVGIFSAGNECELVSEIQRGLIFSKGSHLLFLFSQVLNQNVPSGCVVCPLPWLICMQGCFSPLIPLPPFPPFHLLCRYFYFAFFIRFLQVSLLPLSSSFAPSPPLPSDVCTPPVIKLKVTITSVSFSGRFCLLTSAGIWRNKQRGENRTAVREVMEPFLTKLFAVCVMKHANEARSQDSVEILLLSNPISAQ